MSGWLGGGELGLMRTFLIMLVPMLAASALGWWARRTYLRDVATAAASMEAISRGRKHGEKPLDNAPQCTGPLAVTVEYRAGVSL